MKKMMIAGLLCYAVFCQAQEKDLYGVRYNNNLVNANGAKGNIQTVEAFGVVPVSKDTNNLLFGLVTLGETSLHHFSPQFAPQLYSGSLSLSYIKKLDEKHKLSLLATIMANSDFNRFGMADMRYILGARYFTKVSDRFGYAIGLGYSKQYFGNLLMPFVEIDYEISRKLKLYGPFPLNTRLRYAFSGKSHIGLGLTTNIKSYQTTVDKTEGYIKHTDVSSLFFYRYNLKSHLWLFANMGYSLRQKIDLYNNGQNMNNWTIITQSFGDAPIPVQSIQNRNANFQVGVSLSL